MKPLLAALLLCLGCRAHFEEQVQRDEHTQSETDSDRVIDKHVVDAPDKTTTTIEEFATTGPQLTQGQESGTAGAAGPRTASRPAQLLVKRTVIVAEHGAVTTDLHIDAKSQARADSVVDETRHTESTFDFLHSPFALLGGLVVLAGVAYLAWKFILPRLLP